MRFDRLVHGRDLLVFGVLALAFAAGQGVLAEIPGVPDVLGKAFSLTTLVLLAGALVWGFRLLGRARHAEAQTRILRARTRDQQRRLDHDTVTGLIGHDVFRDRVCAVCLDGSPERKTVVLALDLPIRQPGFGIFSAGEETVLLSAAADLLRHALDRLPLQTFLTRAMGSRFFVLAVGAAETDVAGSTASAITDCFLRPLRTEAGAVQLSPEVGYVVAEGGETGSDLLRRAGLACSLAGADHRNRALAFDPLMAVRQERAEAIGAVLADAIADDNCLPHFQPQFNLASGQVFGLEALARWYHPGLGWISPEEFVPIAESTGDIVELGWKILETASDQVRFLPEGVSLSVNLSLAQLAGGDAVAMVEDCLSRSALAPSRLTLEVSERAPLNDIKRVQASLVQLRDLGVRLALDDFGAGYASLTYVTDLPWDDIKIDRSLTARMVADTRVRAMLTQIRRTAEDLGARVLVEGIETVEQRDTLMDLGFDRGQGYLFGGPMAIDDITSLFFPARHRPDRAGAGGA